MEGAEVSWNPGVARMPFFSCFMIAPTALSITGYPHSSPLIGEDFCLRERL
jgi:hypothetical protein